MLQGQLGFHGRFKSWWSCVQYAHMVSSRSVLFLPYLHKPLVSNSLFFAVALACVTTFGCDSQVSPWLESALVQLLCWDVVARGHSGCSWGFKGCAICQICTFGFGPSISLHISADSEFLTLKCVVFLWLVQRLRAAFWATGGLSCWIYHLPSVHWCFSC